MSEPFYSPASLVSSIIITLFTIKVKLFFIFFYYFFRLNQQEKTPRSIQEMRGAKIIWRIYFMSLCLIVCPSCLSPSRGYFFFKYLVSPVLSVRESILSILSQGNKIILFCLSKLSGWDGVSLSTNFFFRKFFKSCCKVIVFFFFFFDLF